MDELTDFPVNEAEILINPWTGNSLSRRGGSGPSGVPYALYWLGDLFRKRGDTLQNFLRRHGEPDPQQDPIIRAILQHIQESRELPHLLHQALENTYSELLGAEDSDSINRLHGVGLNSRLFRLGILHIQVFQLRLDENLIGDREAIRERALALGITGNIRAMADEHELRLAELTELHDELAQGPEYEASRNEVFQIAERGELLYHPLRGWVDPPTIVNVGPDTLVSDISSPVDSAEELCGERCPFCLGDFTAPETAVRLKCKHLTCPDCLDTWVNSMAELCNCCPVCRAELFVRRPRQPSNLLERFGGRFIEVQNIKHQIRMLRINYNELCKLLEELDPSQVVQALGP